MVVGGGPERGGEGPRTGGARTWEGVVRDLASAVGGDSRKKKNREEEGVRRV
jgi:hypothetical protein